MNTPGLFPTCDLFFLLEQKNQQGLAGAKKLGTLWHPRKGLWV